MKTTLLASLAVVFLLLGASFSLAEEFTVNGKTYSLRADRVTYNLLTKTIQGIGHAKLICPNGQAILAPQITIPDCTGKAFKCYVIGGKEKPPANDKQGNYP
jgi:hypothetical protein